MSQSAGAHRLLRLPTVGAATAATRAGAHLRARSRRVWIAFLAIVVIPTALSALYSGVLATPRYVSEAQFVVRGVSDAHATGLEALFQTFGISRTVDDANIVQGYILSRDAIKALEARIPLRAMFQRADVDRLGRFPRPWEWDSDERFYRYYLDRVFLVQDSGKGISTLSVVAFSAEDAQKISTQLLLIAEELANRMNVRARNDSVGFAERHVADAEKDVLAAQAALTGFRNKYLVVDPGQSSQLQLEMIAALSLDFAKAEAAMREATLSAGSSPTIVDLKAKADALQERIAAERIKLAGSDQALASKVSEYERLILERDLANKSLSAAIQSLELARQDALRQMIYVEQIVAPHLPDESTEPNVLRTTATFLVLGFAIFGAQWIITVGAQEHEQ